MEDLNKLTKKELIERLKKKDNKTEPKKGTIKIVNRFNNEIIYESETAKTKEEAIMEAVKSKANLSEANLSWANLSGANLSKADLSWANLSKANLSEADLSKANLSWANYWKTNLWKVKLTKRTKEQLESIIEWEVRG